MLALLLSLADESDHDKIVYLYEKFHDMMVRAAKRKLAMARIPNYADVAEDAVQNAFVKLTMYIKSTTSQEWNEQEISRMIESLKVKE